MSTSSRPKTSFKPLPFRKDLRKYFRHDHSIIKFKNEMLDKDSFEYMFPLKLIRSFKHFDYLKFMIFKVDENTFTNVAMFYLTIHNILGYFKIPIKKMERFLKSVEKRYRKMNAYHNSIHAVDVLQTAHALMNLSKKFDGLKELEKFILFLGVIGHDIEHTGFSNRYLVMSSHEYALDSNDQSPLEHHHLKVLFMLLRKRGILDHFEDFEKMKIREYLIDMILATDAARYIYYEKLIQKLIFNSTQKNIKEPSDPKGLLILLMKCSDISNPIKSPGLYLRWTGRILTEFFNQGDEEKKNGYTVSAFMSRNTTNIAKCQIGFIKYLVFPIYTILKELDPVFEFILEDLRKKIKFWERDELKDFTSSEDPQRILELNDSFCEFMNGESNGGDSKESLKRKIKVV